MSEWFHNILHGAQSQIQDVKLTVWGHVTSYDPEKHAIKAIIPHYRTEDDDPVETSWIPLGSLFVGDRFGMQYAPKGGATQDDPGKGELVQITILQRNNGHMLAAHLCFNDLMSPPGSGQSLQQQQQQQDHGDPNDPDGVKKLEPGELVIRHESGSFVKFYKDGNIQLYSAKDLQVYAQNDLTAVIREGDLDVTVDQGNVAVKITKGDLDCTLDEGSAAITATVGDIDVTTTSGAVSVDAGTDVEVTAQGVINLIAPLINAAANPATVQALCNLLFLELFNTHVHDTAFGPTSAPTVPAIPGIETTVDFMAG